MLRDALVLDPVVGEQGGCTRMHLGHVRFPDRLPRRRGDQRVGEGAPVGVEHPLDAELRLGRDRLARLESGERAGAGLVGIRSQDSDGAREGTRGGRQPVEPIADEPHELRRRAAVAHEVDAADAGLLGQLPEIERVATGRRPRASDDLDGFGPSENRLDESRGAGDRERRRLEPHERALGGQRRRAGDRVPPAERRRRARAAARPTRRAAVRNSRRVRSSAHWPSSRNSASGRSSANSTISHHSALTTSSLREPGPLGSDSAPSSASSPSRAGPSRAMPRAAGANSSRAPASGTFASNSSAVA